MFNLSCKSLSANVRICLAVLELILTKFSFKNEEIVRFSVFASKSWRSPIFVEEGCDFAYLGCIGKVETFRG